MNCFSSQDCGWLLHCNSEFLCQHNSVFPLSVKTVFIYLIIPFACGLANSTGHSMGQFKVLIVITILNYQGIQATMISQALIVGAAFPNYFSIISRKHPLLPTSLVNFNLVYILVPCTLLGSTLGSLITQFIPNLIQQILTFLAFCFFAWQFYKKYRKLKQKEFELEKSIQTKQHNQIQLQNTTIPQEAKHNETQHQNPTLVEGNHQSSEPSHKQNQPVNNQDQVNNQQSLLGNASLLKQSLISESQSPELKLTPELKITRGQILEYEKSIHLKDILFSLLVFIVFQFIVFLVQGRIPFFTFSHCNWKYWVGISTLILLTLCYLKLIHKYLKNKFDIYEKVQIYQQIMLNKNSEFWFILTAGLLAGFAQGILGAGSGSCMMIFLLSKPILAISASATVGYQVLFIGLAALSEGFINGAVNLEDTAFFIVLCFVLGGAVTVGMACFLQTRNQALVSKIVIIIAFSLSLVSVVMVVPDVIYLIKDQGLKTTMQIKFRCNG